MHGPIVAWEGLYFYLLTHTLYKPFISKALGYDPCVKRVSHSFTCHPHTNHACLYSPQPKGIAALWPVLIVLTPGRLVTIIIIITEIFRVA